MRSILVMNAKGGSGKTTIAVNLACYYALEGYEVALVDYDPQYCALDWLDTRPEGRPKITGVEGLQKGARVPRNTDVVVLDAPAATHGRPVTELLSRTQTCIIPVIPSAIDLNAAARFIDEITDLGRVLNRKVRVATVANRIRENSPGHFEIEEFLETVKLPNGRKLPFVACLRNSINYSHAADRGLSIFEIAPSKVEHDLEMWEPLLAWLDSRASLPAQ
jgi:chromosome partitioning protein